MKFFDFGDRQKSEETIYRTWIDLRDSLKNKEFSYKDIDKAKSITFLRVFDSLFNQHSGFRYITKQIKDINRGIGRGTKLSPDEKVNFERFIPKKEYITHDNRFSPEGIEWLYLALDTDVAAIEVSKREIHTHLGDRFGFCSFAFDKRIFSLLKHFFEKSSFSPLRGCAHFGKLSTRSPRKGPEHSIFESWRLRKQQMLVQ